MKTKQYQPCHECRAYHSSTSTCRRFPQWVKHEPEDWCSYWLEVVKLVEKEELISLLTKLNANGTRPRLEFIKLASQQFGVSERGVATMVKELVDTGVMVQDTTRSPMLLSVQTGTPVAPKSGRGGARENGGRPKINRFEDYLPAMKLVAQNRERRQSFGVLHRAAQSVSNIPTSSFTLMLQHALANGSMIKDPEDGRYYVGTSTPDQIDLV